jgi:hypothetical protein
MRYGSRTSSEAMKSRRGKVVQPVDEMEGAAQHLARREEDDERHAHAGEQARHAARR